MTEVLQNTKYEVLTPYGFEDFRGLKPTDRSEWLTIQFEDGTMMKCTPEHKMFTNSGSIQAHLIKQGDYLNAANCSNKQVTDVQRHESNLDFYDLIGVDMHTYYANDILVSNCDCDFSTSGNTVIHPELLTWMEQSTVQEPVLKRNFDNNLWIWEHADYSKSYIVCADVARGDSTDYSAFHIIDVESCTQVAEYKGQLTTKDFGNLLVGIATEYNDALLVIENANIGWATVQVALDRDYKNLYYTYKEGELNPEAYLNKQYDLANKKDAVAGFTMTQRIRPLAISKLDLYMREKSCIIRSKRLIDELRVFVWKAGRGEAQYGYNDDLVMSWVEGLWVRDTAMKLRQSGIELSRLALNHMTSGQKLLGIHTPGKFRDNPWKMDNGHGGQEDLGWLM